MVTILSLKEIVDRHDVKAWNMIQKDLWLSLVKNNVVNYNDMGMFFKMGQIFCDYFEVHKEPPSYNELVQLLI